MPCELCDTDGGHVVWRDGDWRVVRVDEAAFPAFYRVIRNAHVKEFSDLDEGQRARCMALVAAVERALRVQLKPAKVNLASLGNMTPHLHWHVIARFEWDSHFPSPVWAAPQRSVQPAPLERLGVSLQELDAAVARELAA